MAVLPFIRIIMDNREHLKYGTEFTSVRVRQDPGGKSSLNLGWEDPKKSKNIRPGDSKFYQQDDRSNINREYEDPVYESRNTANKSRGNRDPSDHYSEYSDAKKKPVRNNYAREEENERNNDYGRGNERNYEYSRGNPKKTDARRAENKYDEYARPNERTYEEPQREKNYYEGRSNEYGRNPNKNRGYAREEYGRDEYARDEYARDDYARDEHPREDYARGQIDNRRKEGGRYQADNERSQQEYNYERNPEINRRRDDGRYNAQYEPEFSDRQKPKPKTSVKVQNPPGGQSSFIFG